eukprot:CAMPEP_0204333972 /NCGR_PEP_ID=MMETSP0469-20131031/17662_1 /ASSEMBLY_ACC=CAM_ASM_000384 /TAXON_ID=2969 /ORGANISM="Oxyrrhis marina" /LENGTH=45 /DNA_ID= /DNA_START= /DNA_END= /DNA_ORIENTATION=
MSPKRRVNYMQITDRTSLIGFRAHPRFEVPITAAFMLADDTLGNH